MLHVLDPKLSTTESALTRSGSFAWWYVDALDADLNGFVCIWSWGLPFLPGLAGGLRAGSSIPGVSRPSFNLVVYERGVPKLYVLQEHEPSNAQCLQERWRFGRTVIERTGTTITINVDCDVPGSVEPLRGSVTIDGPAWTEVKGTTPVSDRTHGWCPQLGPCRAQGLLSHGSRQFSYDGPAYADRNAGDRPLHDLGIRRWVWGRATFGDETRIAYVLWPEDGGPPTPLAIRVGADGVAEVTEGVVTTGSDGWSAWGESTPKTLSLEVDGEPFVSLTVRQQVDSSPFYARAVGHGTAPGRDTVPAVIESCTPSRIDPGWFRPLLNMATHNVGGANSMWLPLFNGPHQGRWGRLFASWRGVGRP